MKITTEHYNLSLVHTNLTAATMNTQQSPCQQHFSPVQ